MRELESLVREGDADLVAERVRLLLEEGESPEAILQKGLIPSMDLVGDLFQAGEIYLPEMLVASRAMKSGLEVLKPLLVDSAVRSSGKVVLGSVRGDMHDIGKNLVALALEGAGFEVVDLGVDVPPDRFAESLETHSPLAVGLSALLTSTMESMRETIRAIESRGLRGGVKIMVGGAPVTERFAVEIGADFYGPDSTAGREYVRSLLK